MATKATAKVAPSDEEVKFLMTVIKVGGIGSIDWQKVSDAMGIVSKAAASKRFSRLNTKYKDLLDGVASAGSDGEDGAKTPASESPKKKAAPKKGGAKKRKLAEAGDDEETKAVKGGSEDEVGA